MTTTNATHLEIDQELCGQNVLQVEGRAVVSLKTTTRMRADARDLTHGGFYFGMADYAAMLAVNDPNVVLGAAETKFKKPVKTGDMLVAEATVVSENAKKRSVEVIIKREGEEVFSGIFTCFVLPKHVFDL
eukprot:gene12665-14973_t